MTSAPGDAVGEAFSNEWGRIVAGLIRMTGDWDLAEECAQEAFAEASRRWKLSGVPDRPGAWLTTVARNRALDRLRRRVTESRKLSEVAAIERLGTAAGGADQGDIPDDRLRLIFTCCHPALALESRVGLTLRSLAGLTTSEIARAFLVPEATMAKRLVRAKQKIANAAIPYRVPPRHLLDERTAGVLAVVYLLFNEGYSATAGAELVRVDLCSEAIRLCRCVAELMPDSAETLGLLALMLLQDSRRGARVDDAGELVTLESQDRSKWDGAQIAEAERILGRANALQHPGPYQLQAAIALCHARAAEASQTDWGEIARLYGELGRLTPSPVIELNRAVAVAMAEGPATGLSLVDALAGELGAYRLFHATRADLCRRLGRAAEAAAAYRLAIELGGSEVERRYLERRLEEVSEPGPRAQPPR